MAKGNKEAQEKQVTGGELTDYPNEQYAKFFAKFSEIDSLDIAQWKPVHILSYFCKKYQEQYNTKYQFKFNSPSPTKCFEVFQVKKLSAMLTANPKLLRDYIDWIFLNKVVKAKRKLTSISFMTHEDVVKEYKLGVLLIDKKDLHVDRSTPLPQNLKDILAKVQFNLNTYGELSFLAHMDPKPIALVSALQEMTEQGFDEEVLKRIV